MCIYLRGVLNAAGRGIWLPRCFICVQILLRKFLRILKELFLKSVLSGQSPLTQSFARGFTVTARRAPITNAPAPAKVGAGRKVAPVVPRRRGYHPSPAAWQPAINRTARLVFSSRSAAVRRFCSVKNNCAGAQESQLAPPSVADAELAS